MAISHTQEYEQLILLDLQSDKKNLIIVNRLLAKLDSQLGQVKDFLVKKGERVSQLADLLEKMAFLEQHELELNEFQDTREINMVLNMVRDQEITVQEITSFRENILIFYDKISPCRFFDKALLRKIKKEGFEIHTKLMREIQYTSTRPPLKYLLDLSDQYSQMLDVQEDLLREKRKFELKLTRGEEKILLREIKEYRKNYSKDTILLIEGLLKTEGDYYHSLRSQLDDQYNKIIQNKLVKLNKLVNVQEKIFIDQEKITGLLREYNKHFQKIKRYILE